MTVARLFAFLVNIVEGRWRGARRSTASADAEAGPMNETKFVAAVRVPRGATMYEKSSPADLNYQELGRIDAVTVYLLCGRPDGDVTFRIVNGAGRTIKRVVRPQHPVLVALPRVAEKRAERI